MRTANRAIVMSVVLLVLTAGIARAQVNSTTNTIGLGWGNPENLNIQVTFGPGTGQFQQSGGAVTPTTSPITLQANYNGLVNRTSLSIYAYFADGARALSNAAGNSVPAANVQATITGGATAAFNSVSPFSTASVLIATSTAVATNGTGNLPASFSLSILGTNYPSGFYSGTLFIQAQAV